MEPSGSGTDMFGAAPTAFSTGGAAHNMTREEVITSRVCHWRDLICSSDLPEHVLKLLRSHASSIIGELQETEVDTDLMVRMVKEGSAPPWSEEMLPEWDAAILSIPHHERVLVKSSVGALIGSLEGGGKHGRRVVG
jgi:hypothetical protein